METNNDEELSMQEMLNALNGTLKKIHPGDVVKGKVISATDKEVFVNIGYMSDGIVAKDDLSYEDSINPKEAFNPGDEIYVYVVDVNDGEGNVVLSKKLADSVKVWDELNSLKENDGPLKVKVSEIVKGGAIAYIKGIRAFIPISQLSANYIENADDFLGKELLVKIIEIDKDKEKVVLSRKEVEKLEIEHKKDKVWASLEKGQKRSGIITRLAKFGAFVDLGGIDGLIHISDLSWNRVNKPEEVVSIGDSVEVYVIDFDKSKGRISLGLKEVNKNPWINIADKYKAGNIISAKVVRIVDFGAFVEIEPGIEGLVHISEISEERILKPSDKLKIGDAVKAKIMSIDEKNKKISLSIKEAEGKEEEISLYSEGEEEKITLGDLFKDKLKNFKFGE